jgi:hypothetical protein
MEWGTAQDGERNGVTVSPDEVLKRKRVKQLLPRLTSGEAVSASASWIAAVWSERPGHPLFIRVRKAPTLTCQDGVRKEKEHRQ